MRFEYINARSGQTESVVDMELKSNDNAELTGSSEDHTHAKTLPVLQHNHVFSLITPPVYDSC